MGKKVKVYLLPRDGLTYWVERYRRGVEAGAEKYKAMIPYMESSYKGWASYTFTELVKVAQTLPAKVEGADPAENYSRRGAPFARLFKSLSKKYQLEKIARALTVAPPAPPAVPREVPTL